MASSFSVFYFFNNVGSFIGESSGPILRQTTSFQITVLVFTISVVMSTILYLTGTSTYHKVPPQARDTSLFYSLKSDLQSLKHIIRVWIPLPVFWALFVQVIAQDSWRMCVCVEQKNPSKTPPGSFKRRK